MLNWLKELDRILRGDATRPEALRKGSVEVLEQELTFGLVLLSLLYGVCMGCYALVSRDEPEFRQLFASMFKVPALFFLTLLVTFPSLYVFNALVGCRLTLVPMLRLLLAALAVLLAVLASLGPIVAFFSITTTTYSFVLLLNVLVFAVASVLGLGFLLKTLHRLSVIHTENVEEPTALAPPAPDAGAPASAEAPEEIPVALRVEAVPAPRDVARPGRQLDTRAVSPQVKVVFYAWVVVFALVGAQMAWVLRPFVGDPKHEFVLFGHRETSHVFQGVWRALANLATETADDKAPAVGSAEPRYERLPPPTPDVP